MASTIFLRLLVILLGLSHLIIFLNAVPVTRTGRLMLQAPSETLMQESFDDEPVRIAVELNDYPGSGANNRHTPRPQFGRGCIDC